MSDRQIALQFLEKSVKDAFGKGLKASIAGSDYYFLKKGSQVEVCDHTMVTTDSGIFQKALVPDSQHKPDRQTLLHFGHAEQLSSILEHLCRDMSVHDIEMTMVGITSHSVLANKYIRMEGSSA